MKTDNTESSISYFDLPYTTIKTQHIVYDDGYQDITLYRIADGIFMAINDVHARTIPFSMYDMHTNPVIINHCMDGRCEFSVSEDCYTYLGGEQTAISTRPSMTDFYYPTGKYYGIQIFMLGDRISDVSELYAIDIALLKEIYCSPDPLHIHRCQRHELKLWEDLHNAHEKGDVAEVRLYCLIALHSLCSYYDTGELSRQTFLTSTQIRIAKEAERIITEDLSRHIPIREIAASFRVSETSMKNYFYAVYGSNISTYLSDKRMSEAAHLLSETDLPIIEISRRIGYVNQGKFAAVFKNAYGMKPLDYRRNAGLHLSSGSHNHHTSDKKAE